MIEKKIAFSTTPTPEKTSTHPVMQEDEGFNDGLEPGRDVEWGEAVEGVVAERGGTLRHHHHLTPHHAPVKVSQQPWVAVHSTGLHTDKRYRYKSPVQCSSKCGVDRVLGPIYGIYS